MISIEILLYTMMLFVVISFSVQIMFLIYFCKTVKNLEKYIQITTKSLEILSKEKGFVF